MRRPSILTTALLAAAGVVLFAGGASAQNAGAPAGEARGLRYLSWSSRSEANALAPAAVPGAAGRRDLRRPNTVIPHGGFTSAAPVPTRPGLTPAPGAGRTLTPANAWMHPVAPPPEPVRAEPPPAAPAPPRPAPLQPPAPQPRTTPDYLPDPGGRGQAAPAEMIYAPAPSQAPPGQSDPFDPMAPRRDAPIFRMQQDAPAPNAAPPVVQPAVASPQPAPRPRRVAEVSNSGERPPTQGGRYYSVHRQNGRQPDALEMPEPNYVDALVVAMPETIASQDLAAPEQGPTLIRDVQGRVRPAPAASDGDHQ